MPTLQTMPSAPFWKQPAQPVLGQPVPRFSPECGRLGHRRLVFLHIPRSGGTTVHELLHGVMVERFGEGAVCPARFDDLRGWSLPAMARHRLFSGHFTLTTIRRIPDPKVSILILRDPRKRVVSQYQHARAHRPEVLAGNMRWFAELANELSLEQFLNDSRVSGLVDNPAVRQLCGFDLDSDQSISDQSDLLERAFRNLGCFDLIGITEEIESFADRLEQLLDVQFDRPIDRRNAREGFGDRAEMKPVEPVTITPEMEAAIARRTALDRILYERVKDASATGR